MGTKSTPRHRLSVRQSTYNNIQSDNSTEQLVQRLLRTAKPLLGTNTSSKQPTNRNMTADNNDESELVQGAGKSDSESKSKPLNKKKRKRKRTKNRGCKKKRGIKVLTTRNQRGFQSTGRKY